LPWLELRERAASNNNCAARPTRDQIGVYDESHDFQPNKDDRFIGPLVVELLGATNLGDLSQCLGGEIDNLSGLDLAGFPQTVRCRTSCLAEHLLA